MFSYRVLVVVFLAVWSFTSANVVFEDSKDTNVGTRNGDYDSVVIDAPGSAPSGDVDSRFLGLGLLGGGGGFGGGGFPIGGAGYGPTKPGRCPGILGLGIGQPEGGYNPGFGNGYPGYGGGYPGYGYGGYPGGFGGYNGGYGGYGYPGQYGHGGYGGYGFRSGETGGEHSSGRSGETRRKRSEEGKTNQESSGDVQGRNLHGDKDVDARFIGGLFGQQCYNDAQCPGQLKCCGALLGSKATCQQPALIG